MNDNERRSLRTTNKFGVRGGRQRGGQRNGNLKREYIFTLLGD